MTPFSWPGSLLLASAFASVLHGQPTVSESPWYPAQERTEWTYRLAGKKLTIRVARHEKQFGVMCARVETVDKGEVIAVQHIAVGDKEVRRIAHNGEKVDPPLVFLKLPPAKGQSWDVDSKTTNRSGADAIVGTFTTEEEDVKVPAGDYMKAIRVTAELTVNGQKTTITSWYAEKVGLVRQRVAIAGRTHVMELEKLELPK